MVSSGEAFIDRYPPGSSYKYVVGYIVQDDIISGTLTVKENLMFSANAHLSDDISNDERKQRVTKVMHDFRLEACADTKGGAEFLRGVSGGERQRTCIGVELILSRKILFLDEPTTVLDASTAQNVMECLKQYRPLAVQLLIFSIHQPRYFIFKLFDTVLLMAQVVVAIVLGLVENVSGYCRTTTFFIAKAFCDVLPIRIVSSILFSLIAYFMTGLEQSAGQFFGFLVTVFMTSAFGSAICLFVSAAYSYVQ
ncbi:unnamed protein product [Rotaria socialis]